MFLIRLKSSNISALIIVNDDNNQKAIFQPNNQKLRMLEHLINVETNTNSIAMYSALATNYTKAQAFNPKSYISEK